MIICVLAMKHGSRTEAEISLPDTSINPRTEARISASGNAAQAPNTACKAYMVAKGLNTLWRHLAASVAIFTTAIHGKNARSRGKIAKK